MHWILIGRPTDLFANYWTFFPLLLFISIAIINMFFVQSVNNHNERKEKTVEQDHNALR